MKKVGRKVVSVLLTLCMLLTMLPVSALAADEGTVDTAPAETNLAEPVNTGNSSSDEGEPPVSTLVAGTENSVDYVDENGQTQTCTEYTTVVADITTWSNGWYVVTGTVTLDDRVEVSDSVNLILADGAVLNATKGIGVTYDNSLTIYGQSGGTGKLTAGAYQVYNSAAIGGTDDKDQNRNLCAHGDITINGGDITATGASAGIGGGESATGTSGTITINGGTVKATGGSDAAGIGGGYANTTNGGAIIINGGTVTATGGSKAAGIGAGYSSAGMGITINGGTVNATGGGDAAGIGAGNGSSTPLASITITGGAVTATGGTKAAGIGGGAATNAKVGDITITGGIVNATGGDSDTYGGAGIGAGGNGACGSITIGGSADVTATGGESEYRSGAGIGAGGGNGGADIVEGEVVITPTCNKINITGGTVDATGGTGADGIGGNASSTVESVSISGGTFTANTFPNGEIPADYLAAGFAPVKDSNGNWSVEEKEETPPAPTGVAQIGDKTYETLEAAFAAVEDNQKTTITLLKDIAVSAPITIGEAKSVNFDMKGHTITAGEGFSTRVFTNNGTLTITGNGTIDVTAAGANGYGAVNNFGTLNVVDGTYKNLKESNASTFYNRNGGTATFENPTIYGGGGCIGTEVNTTTTINGGYYENETYPAVENRGNMTITAGTFKNTSCSSCDGSKWGYTVRSGESSENAYLKIEGTAADSVKVTGVQGGLAVIGGTADIYNGVYETVACDVHTTGSSAYYAGYFTGESYETAVTIYDGTFQSVSKTAVLVGNDNPPPDSGAGEASTVMIRGGTFIGGDKAKTAITVDNTDYAKGGASISGGTFSSMPSEEFFAEGYAPEYNEENGTWGVVAETTYVAQIGENKYATLSEALNKVQDGETIKLLAPATVDMAETYEITGKAITLDLNGQTVTWKSSAKNMIEIGTDGGLTIQDATDAGVLHFIGTGTTSYGSGIYTSGNGSLSLTGGTVLYEHSKAGYGLNITGSSTFTMTGGTVKIAGAVNYAVRLASTSQCQLNGGKILFDEGTTATTLYGVYAVLFSAGDAAGFSLGNLTVDGSMVPEAKTVVCVYGYNDGTPVTISGGTYTANSESASYAVGGGNSNATSISGGTFNGAVKAANGKVTGGLFSVQPSAAYLPEGKIYEMKDDGYYHVVDGTYVARLGTVGYTSWDELWKDASESTTASAVYILADVEEITVPEGENVTFYNSGRCTIGKITNNGTCKIISHAMTGTEVVNNGNLNLGHEVKSVVNNQGATMVATGYIYAKVTDSITNSGTMTISKGTYPCTITNTGTITLTGGSFAQKVTDWCADGYTTQKSGDLWVVVKNGPHVAEIDGYWYTSLSAAINAAKDGDTVKLLMDTTLTPTTTGTGLKNAITISGVSKPNLTLDLNGKTISWDQTCADQTLSSTPVMFSISGGANITITGNGTIDTELGSNTSYGINMTASTKNQLTIENGTFTGAPTAIQVDKGTLTILDGTFKLAKTVATDKPEQAKYVVNAIDANWKDDSANISIQGGSFCFDPSDNPEGEGSSYVAEGFEAVVNTDGSFEIAKVKVAEVDGVQYATLTEAINAATDGQTIKLLANSTGNTTATISDGRKLTLNMNGFNAGFIKYDNISIYQGGLNIIGSGKLYEEEPYFAPVVIYGSNDPEAADYTTVTVGKDVTLEGWSGLFIDQHDEHKETAYGIKATVNGTLHSVRDFQGYGGHALYVQGVITATEGNVPEIILDGATLNTDVGNGMYLAGYAKTTITNSTITSTGENSTGIEIRAGVLTISGNTTVSGGNGEFVADPNGNGSTTNNVALAVVQHTTKLPVIVTVKGGTFNGGAALYQADQQDNGADAVAKVQISVEDGTFNGVVYSENKTNFITGGTFSEKPNEAYCAEGYAPVENDNGTWGVEVETTYVAEVNSQKYESLIDAVNVAKESGQTVKLLADVELKPIEGKDYALLIDNGESMTLDLNGYKITATLNNTKEFNLIKNYGELTITDTSEGKGGSIEVTENGSAEKSRTSVIYNVSTGEFTLEAGALKLTGSADSKKTLYGVYSSGIKMVMDGGAIEVRRLNSDFEYSKAWDVYGIYNSNNCQTTVNGGKITVENQGRYNSAYGINNASGTVSIHGDPNTPYIEANAFDEGTWYEHTLYGNITLYGGKYNMLTDTATGWIETQITIADGYEKKFNGDRTVSIVKSPVAQIGSTKYYTLEEALKEARSGDTIKLLQNVALTDRVIISKNITLNLNDKTISSKANYAFIVNTGNSFTLENGTLSASQNGVFGLTSSTVTLASDATINAGAAGITATNNLLEQGNATINVYGTIHSQDIAVWSQGPKNTINIDSATITSKYFGVYQNGSFGGTTITIKNSTITDESENGTGIYVSNNGTNAENPDQGFQNLIIENSQITGNTAVEVKFTNVTISGDETCLNATGTPVDSGMNNSGSVTTGYAFAVTHNGTESSKDAAKGRVTISGGKFTGAVGIQEPSEGETTSATIAISGGSFSEEPNKDYLAPHYEATQNTPGDNYWTVDVAANVEAIWITDTAEEAGMLSDLLGKATSGTVQLLKDVTTTAPVYVNEGATLDLAGKTLTAEALSTFGGYVKDSTEGEGLLKVGVTRNTPNITLKENNPSLLIYDSDAAGYRLYSYTFEKLRAYTTDQSGKSMGFYFRLTFENLAAWSKLNTAETTHGVIMSTVLELPNKTIMTVYFDQSTIQGVAGSIVGGAAQTGKGFWLTVTGLNKLEAGQTLKVTPTLEAAGDKLVINTEAFEYSKSADESN